MRIILGNVLTGYYNQSNVGIMPFFRILDVKLDDEGEVTKFELDTLISDPNSTVYAFMPYVDIDRKDKHKLDVFTRLSSNSIDFINYALDLAYDSRSSTKVPYRSK